MNLVHYDAARRELAEARRIDEVKAIRDKAVAMKMYALQAKDMELIAHATEIKLRAERRAGELLVEMAAKGERQKAGDNQHGANFRLVPSLEDLGVSDMQSTRWRRLAALEQQKFEERVATATEEAVAAIAMTSDERAEERRQRRDERAASMGKAAELSGTFSIIVADPPWEDEFGPTSRQPELHYPVMTQEELEALPVKRIAADDSVLYLWAPAHLDKIAHEVMEAWEFEYRTHQIWVKDTIGLGAWARSQHEVLMIGRRGEFPPPLESMRVSSVFNAPKRRHSEKPEIHLERIERWWPDAPKIELFRRGPARPGWSAWGNQAE